jgi:hypothetical protein
MTPDQVKIVQESFKSVLPIAPQAADLFYGRLCSNAIAITPARRQFGLRTTNSRSLVMSSMA